MAAISADMPTGDVVFKTSEASKWSAPLSGAAALGQEPNLRGISYEPETGEFKFASGDQVVTANDSEIAWQSDFGLRVKKESGQIYVWDVQEGENGEWIKAEPANIEEVKDGAQIFKAGSRNFIEVDGKETSLTKIENDPNGATVVTLLDGRTLTWNEGVWNEIKDYGVCTPEDFRRCEIPAEDLFNGKYLTFLRTLAKPFDPNKIKTVPYQTITSAGGPVIVYQINSTPNFSDESVAPFRRNVTSGFVKADPKDTEVGQHPILGYMVLPIEYPDPEDPANKDKNIWVIGIEPIRTQDEQLIQNTTDVWTNKMHIAPIVQSSKNPFDGSQTPLVQRSFIVDPLLSVKFDKFIKGDTRILDGKVVLLFVGINDKGWLTKTINPQEQQNLA
jgi:hypothetical protein